MGQHVSSINSQIHTGLTSNTTFRNPAEILTAIGPEDSRLFFSWEISSNKLSDKRELSRQSSAYVQNFLCQMTNMPDLKFMDSHMHKMFALMMADYEKVMKNINENLNRQEKLKESLKKIWSKSNDAEEQTSVLSMLLQIFRSAGRYLAIGEPQLTASSNQMTEKSLETMLDNFFASKMSLQAILPVLHQILFDNTNIYDVRQVLQKFNAKFVEFRQEWEQQQQTQTRGKASDRTIDAQLLRHLLANQAFPNATLENKERSSFTGQFVAYFVFVHIEFHNKTFTNAQFNSGLVDDTMSFAFHASTFEELFKIIHELSRLPKADQNENLFHVLIICLRLFQTHLKFLMALARPLLNTDGKVQSACATNESDAFISNDTLNLWFDTLLALACHESKEIKKKMIANIASKCVIQLIERKFPSFKDRLSFMYEHLRENKHSAFIKNIILDLNTDTTLLQWIEVLSDENPLVNTAAFNILYLLLNTYFHPSDGAISTEKELTQQVIKQFQQIILAKLTTTYSLVSKYILYILDNYSNKPEVTDDLLNPILIGLGLLTEERFSFRAIHSVITNVTPVLVKFLSKTSDNLYYISWLLGFMHNALIVGPKNDSMEIKYMDKLQSPLFSGGCERPTMVNDQSSSILCNYSPLQEIDLNFEQPISDDAFLMSIYNNIDEGAQLISKIKASIKDKQYPLQQSIEQKANNACSAMFAVYVKFYRRTNLAKYELTKPIDTKPHKKLLAIFEYATNVYTLFTTTKAQGGNCDELCDQIKANASFLLKCIKASNLMHIIECEISDAKTAKPKYLRQYSRRPIRKYDFRLLRNAVLAFTRLRKMMLSTKKTNEENTKNEHILRRSIESFIFNEKTFDTNAFLRCMEREHERALIRLIAYKFTCTSIQDLLNHNDQEKVLSLLQIYLPYLRKADPNWSYFDNISATNIQLKENIVDSYYSIINILQSSSLIDSTILLRNIFYLITLSYQPIDLFYLYKNNFLAKIYNALKSLHLDTNFICYNWLRLYIMKFCEYYQLESNTTLDQIREMIFNKIIHNELQLFRQSNAQTNALTAVNHSLLNISIQYFIKAQSNSTTVDMHLHLNQYLSILLRCINDCNHLQSFIATPALINDLIHLYEQSNNEISCLLSLKILRKLILFLSNDLNAQSKSIFDSFSRKILASIENTTPSLQTELVYIYRTLISFASPWQERTIQLISNIITSNMKALQSINDVLALLNILGGFIQPYCLGSVVEIRDTDETRLGIIIEIQKNHLNSNRKAYLVQTIEPNEIKYLYEDQLKVLNDVPPPNFLDLPDEHPLVSLLFDALIYFIKLDVVSNVDTLEVLKLKRRSIAVLYRLLNHKKHVDIFIRKSYASVIAKLSMSALTSKTYQHSTVLHALNKHQLEQYSLSLDDCKQFQEAKHDDYLVWTTIPFEMNLPVEDAYLSSDWRSTMTKREMKIFKTGRCGPDNIQIVEATSRLANSWFQEQCGLVHEFPGRIHLVAPEPTALTGTFIIQNVQVTEGNWYFCARILESTSARIGWATEGFQPANNIGVGSDQYSWSYDGSQGMIYNGEQYPFQMESIFWNANDVCGCGISIEADQIKISYWLNGCFIGTAFEHNALFPSSTTARCNMLPNGRRTNFFPAVSLQVNDTLVLSTCEFIFHPMDMFECPLPPGYKPLVVPNLVDMVDTLAPYPDNAYLVGNDINDYFIEKRNNKSIQFLRDFINDDHLENSFSLDNSDLVLSNESQGFPLHLNIEESLTISFIVSLDTTPHDIPLLTIDKQDQFTILLPANKITKQTKIAIVCQSNEHSIKVYINDQCRLFNCSLPPKTSIHILPITSARIRSLAIWKYALTDEHIQGLFTLGLSYVADDFHRKNEYQQHANIIRFHRNQQYFDNGLLVPFNEPFQELKWETKKKQIDEDESKFFNTNDDSIQLFGNKTYLILSKSPTPWIEYTLIFDISINYIPLKLVQLNAQSEICITEDGQLCLNANTEKYLQTCQSRLKLNEYIRLIVTVSSTCIKIYANGLLMLDINVEKDLLTITDNRIELLKESNSTENIIGDDRKRLELKSIAYLTKTLKDELGEKIMSPDHPLDSLVALPYSIISPSLIEMGHDEAAIKFTMELTKARDAHVISTTLRKKRFSKSYENILSKIGLKLNHEALRSLLEDFQFDTDERLTRLAEVLLKHWNDIQALPSLTTDSCWFDRTIQYLNIDSNFPAWLQDKSTAIEKPEVSYEIVDLKKSTEPMTPATPSILTDFEQKHRDLTEETYRRFRIACERRLISVYAHYTILNMLKVWSYDGSCLFPLKTFGDYSFIVKLLRLLDYHYRYKHLYADEAVDRMSLLVNSILKVELNELISYFKVQHTETANIILDCKAPLLCGLQKDIVVQSIKIISDPSLLAFESDNEYDIDRPSFSVILKLVHLFVKLLSEKSIIQQNDIDLLMPYVFPECLINMLFNLFLVTPGHGGKSTILRLFSTLLRASRNFHLSEHIQRFLFNLFNEIQSSAAWRNNQTIRTLQVVLIDIAFLLVRRQTHQAIAAVREPVQLPQCFQDLIAVVDVINALVEKTRHSRFPDAFITESPVLLGEAFLLTRNDIESYSTHFDTLSEHQLIHFMNNNALLKESFTAFIQSLPVESTANPLYYRSYPSLWHIPAIDIQICARIIYQFNLVLEKMIAFIDLSLLPGQSILTDKIQKSKSYILYETKSRLFNTALALTALEANNNIPVVNFETITTDSSSCTIFIQAFEQLHANAHITFRRPHEHVWRAQYLAMHSTDQGGPFRDSVTCICSDICSTRLPLFILCPNGRMNSGQNDDRWIPNVFPPFEFIPSRIRKQYQFIGQLMGMAIRLKHYLNLKFPTLLWKYLTREQITVEDIESIDVQSFKMVNDMERLIRQNSSTMDANELLDSIFDDLRYEAVSSNGKTYELVPNGESIPITVSNLKDYCISYREYRLNEFHRQLECIRQGLYSVVPGYFLALFTADELEELVCGKGKIDVDLLKRHTDYTGHYGRNHPVIQRFWTVLSEMFSEEQKKLFLKFVWGRCTLPNCDDDFNESFRIDPCEEPNSIADMILPRAHTCTFVLDLPSYSSTDIMYERLNYAITYCTSIDGDGSMNEAPNLDTNETDSSSD